LDMSKGCKFEGILDTLPLYDSFCKIENDIEHYLDIPDNAYFILRPHITVEILYIFIGTQ